MKKIIIIIVIILLIASGLFYWNKMNKNVEPVSTPEQILDQATQADTTDDIDKNINSIDISSTSTDMEFKNIDDNINNI